MKKIEVKVLFDGFSNYNDATGDMHANCTCTLINGNKHKVIVDTMTAWDGEKILCALAPISAKDISYVVCTHGHSDHIGGNHLFQEAVHIVGYSMSKRDHYYNFKIDQGEEFEIEPGIRVIPTPGHTNADVTVLVDTGDVGSSPSAQGLVAITGDLFEKEEDLIDSRLWREIGGSEQPNVQEINRKRILDIADYIVPGHGPMFKNCHKLDRDGF